MNELEYIRILKLLFIDANEYTIKVWSREPSYSNLQRTIRLIKSYGYNKIYYTCKFTDKKLIMLLEKTHNIKIITHDDIIDRCIKLERLDLLKIIEKGI